MRTHEECRQKAFLLKAGKKNPTSNLRSYYHGMVVDACMQRWLADPDRRPGQMRSMVDNQIDVGVAEAKANGDGIVRWRHAQDREDVREYCTDLVTRLEPILDTLVTPYRFQAPLRFKVPVVIRDPGGGLTVHLTGELDLLVHTEHGPIIWDLKGTADPDYYRRCIGQVVFYDLALYAMHGTKSAKAGIIQPMCPERVIALDITDDLRRQLWGRIHRMALQIRDEDRACKEGTSGCGYCEVRHACARYQPDTLSGLLRATAKEMT